MPAQTDGHLDSSCLEKVLEHRFVAELTTCLWLAGCRDVEVLRSEVDAHGYDLVVEARGVLRHIQLKSMVRGGKKQHVTINSLLAAKQAGCVVWFDYDPATLELGPFRWFGTLPGLGLPDPGLTIAKHSKADATGLKKQRPRHRVLRKSKFQQVDGLTELVPYLFGYGASEELELLRAGLSLATDSAQAPDWLAEVSQGRFTAIPADLCWENSVELAHLVDGYEFVARLGVGKPFEFEDRQLAHALEIGSWLGGPAVLWATLFLEHRRWRMAPFDPDPAMLLLLDRLCRQLVDGLASLAKQAL